MSDEHEQSVQVADEGTNTQELVGDAENKDENRTKIEQLEAKIKQLEADLEEQGNDTMRLLQDKENDALEQSKTLEDRIDLLTHEKNQIQASFDELKQSSQQKTEELEAQVKAVQEKLGIANANATELAHKLEAAEAHVRVLESAGGHEGGSGGVDKELLKRATTAENQLKALNEALEQEVADKNQQADIYNDAISTLKEQLAKAQDEKRDLLAEVKTDDEKIAQLQLTNSLNAQEIERLNGTIAQQEAKHRQQDQKLQNEISSKAYISRELESVKAQLRTRDEEIRRLQTLQQQLKASGDTTKQKDVAVTELEQNLTTLRGQHATLQQQYNTLVKEREAEQGSKSNGPIVHKSTPWGYIIPAFAAISIAAVAAIKKL